MTTTTVPQALTAAHTLPHPLPSGRAARQRRRLAVADLLTALVWASAALAVVLYLATGTVSVASAGAIVTDLGIVAGLVGTDLVLVMLVLAARIPLIDRTIGHDIAIARHRAIGKPAFYLLLAHGALLTIGYALADGSDVVRETVSLFDSPDMPLAYLGIGLFPVVVVSSLVAVKRRFPQEVWHVIHLVSYAAVLVALPHQLSEGAVLAEGTWQRVYWIGLYALALGAIVLFRFVEPIVQSLRVGLSVESVERIAPDGVAITMRGRGLERLGARGGQFFTWRFLSASTWWQAHPFSLSAETTPTSARITVRELGAGTRRLARIRPGTRVGLEGPYGLFTERAAGRDRFVFLAAGIGVTPVRAALERLDAAPGAVTVIVRARDERELFHWDELHELCTRRGWTLYSSIGPRGTGPGGWLAAADVARGVTLAQAVPAIADSEVYLCGADGWADTAEADVLACGVSRRSIHRERFEW